MMTDWLWKVYVAFTEEPTSTSTSADGILNLQDFPMIRGYFSR